MDRKRNQVVSGDTQRIENPRGGGATMSRMRRGKVPVTRTAFTLIELMIVMAIIAILVGMVLPRFKGLRDQGNVAKAQGELRALKTAMESYLIRWGTYPPPLNGAPGITTAWQASLVTTAPQLITAVLNDPFRVATPYSANHSLNSQYYVIWAFGPDSAGAITGIDNSGVVLPVATRDNDIWTSNAQ